MEIYETGEVSRGCDVMEIPDDTTSPYDRSAARVGLRI